MIKSIKKLPLSLLSTVILTGFIGCSRLLLGGGGAEVTLDESKIGQIARGGASRIAEFKGFGEVTIVKAGQRASGSIDAARRNTGYVKAQVYTTFGSAVASISAEDFEGRAIIDGARFDFKYDDIMAEVPFPCAQRLTYGQFISGVTGSMPDIFWELSVNPDTLIRSKKRKSVTAVWFADTVTVRALLSSKSGGLDAVTFNYDIGGDKFSMKFSRFKKGTPHEILLKEGSKNYIAVNYESIVWQ